MALYTPQSIGIGAPSGGFQQGGWYNGRQYWNGMLGEPNQIINPNQPGYNQPVSQEVVAQSAKAQGKTPEELKRYFEQERQRAAKVTPSSTVTPSVPSVTPGGIGTTASGAGGAGLGALTTTQPTIDLPGLYNRYYESSGIANKQQQLTDIEKKYLTAKGKISDNPFLDASTMDKRLSRLKNIYDTETAPLRNEIATAKADIETQIALQTKQFDINSEQAKLALSQFNSLLEAGALDSATGEDIANITRATGISSTMIQSAVESRKKKETKTEIKTFTNDQGVVTAVVMDQEGNVLRQQSLGAIANAEKGAKEPKATETDEKAAVASIIRSYSTNEGYQAQISPEDLYGQLLLQYPLAAEYIKENWKPKQIRSVTK